jgi:hypothetical protein
MSAEGGAGLWLLSESIKAIEPFFSQRELWNALQDWQQPPYAADKQRLASVEMRNKSF